MMLAPQGRADASPEHGWGGLSRPALNFQPQICGTRGGYCSHARELSHCLALYKERTAKPGAVQETMREVLGRYMSDTPASLGCRC